MLLPPIFLKLLLASTTTIILLILQRWNLHRQWECRQIFGSFWLNVIRICPVATDNPVWEIFLELLIYTFKNYTNGSMLISKQATGCVRSNFVMTSGCKTPIIPITWPLATTSAQRCGKYAGSGRKHITPIKHSINTGNRDLFNALSCTWYESVLGCAGCYILWVSKLWVSTAILHKHEISVWEYTLQSLANIFTALQSDNYTFEKY